MCWAWLYKAHATTELRLTRLAAELPLLGGCMAIVIGATPVVQPWHPSGDRQDTAIVPEEATPKCAAMRIRAQRI